MAGKAAGENKVVRLKELLELGFAREQGEASRISYMLTCVTNRIADLRSL
jgi:hypothetical protein